ncbi:prepilin-type N-terminal cleavage/methylation domain-containing protein [Candidatus Daviesbacteria bacterium]|nr:prepilin-type N-terminal cleavage/methylation domain-containing protein [Candidatus Daviesbacteria bacterium]
MPNKKGFTLVELLVVIAILAILAIIGIVIFTGLTKNANESRKKSDVETIAKVLEAQYSPIAGYPNPLAGTFFASGIVPTPPEGGTYNVVYSTGNVGFRVCADSADTDPLTTCSASSSTCFCKDSSQSQYVAAGGPPPGGGGNPKRVFVTSTTSNGNLGGLAGADTTCNTRASSEGLGGTWVAWLSTTTVAASSRVNQTGAPYELVNGTDIADDWTDLTTLHDGTNYLKAAININESGTTVTANVWTNTTVTGGIPATSADCSGWTSPDSAVTGKGGTTTSTTATWTAAGSTPTCNNSYRLYCFEQ